MSVLLYTHSVTTCLCDVVSISGKIYILKIKLHIPSLLTNLSGIIGRNSKKCLDTEQRMRFKVFALTFNIMSTNRKTTQLTLVWQQSGQMVKQIELKICIRQNKILFS